MSKGRTTLCATSEEVFFSTGSSLKIGFKAGISYASYFTGVRDIGLTSFGGDGVSLCLSLPSSLPTSSSNGSDPFSGKMSNADTLRLQSSKIRGLETTLHKLTNGSVVNMQRWSNGTSVPLGDADTSNSLLWLARMYIPSETPPTFWIEKKSSSGSTDRCKPDKADK